MSYIIVYHSLVVKKDIPALSSEIKERVKKEIQSKLTLRPEIFGVPLRQSLKGCRKLRIGNYRVIFQIKDDRVYILAIMHRSIIYKEVSKRIPYNFMVNDITNINAQSKSFDFLKDEPNIYSVNNRRKK